MSIALDLVSHCTDILMEDRECVNEESVRLNYNFYSSAFRYNQLLPHSRRLSLAAS